MAAPNDDRSLLHGSEVKIFNLVSKGASPRQWAKWLRAPLEYAAADGNFGLVTTLLGAGADGSAGWRGSKGRSLIAAAADGGNEDVVQALLVTGGKGDVNAQFGPREWTALQIAASRGQEGAARALLVAGADPNVTDIIGCGDLYEAAAGGYHVIVGDLLAHGAHPNIKDNGRDSPIHVAASQGGALTVSALLEGGADKNALDSSGYTPLHLAALSEDLGGAEQLLRAGADPNRRSSDFEDGMLPLLEAAATSNLEMVNLLLRHGADVAAVDDEGYGALHLACTYRLYWEGGQTDTVCALIATGIPIDSYTSLGGSTPLHLASKLREVDGAAVLALLQGGANITCKTDQGRAPLHAASIVSDAVAVEILLRWGADETAVDYQGQTPANLIGTAEFHDLRNAADNERVGRMLARAPADRAWRRRGWLVLCRYYPDRARLSDSGDCPEGDEASAISSSKLPSRPTMAARGDEAVGEVGRRGSAVGEGAGGAEATVGWQSLVTEVVGLDVEGVFRTVVGFV